MSSRTVPYSQLDPSPEIETDVDEFAVMSARKRLSNQIRIATQLRAPLPKFRNHRQIEIVEAAIDVLRLELHGDSVLGADRDLRAHLAALDHFADHCAEAIA